MNDVRRDDPRTIASWCLFDWANSAFTTLVVTFIYSAYFTKAIAPNEVTGTALWSRAVGLSAILVAVLSPILGAAADKGAKRKRYLAATTVVAVVATTLLAFVKPGMPHAIPLALGLFVVLYAVDSLLRRPGGAIVGTRWAYVAGFVGGITSSLFGAGGPPYAIYLSHRPLAKEQFRATLTLTTVFSIGLRVTAFALTGLLLKREVLLAAIAVLPAAFIGISLASRLFRRVSHELLLRLVTLLLLATGGSLVARALG